jgi:hypothetical protein
MNALCNADVVEIPVFPSGVVFSGKVRNLFDVVLFYLCLQISSMDKGNSRVMSLRQQIMVTCIKILNVLATFFRMTQYNADAHNTQTHSPL